MIRVAGKLGLALIGLVGITSHASAKPSVFSLQNGFDETYCLMNASRVELPMIFETVIDYTGGNEVASEKAVSDYREYFMAISSRARVSSSAADIARKEIIKISSERRLKWADDWKKNQGNALFFTTSIAAPVAIEVIFQKEFFSKSELEVVNGYLEFLNSQLSQTKQIKNDWETDNKSFDYSVFLYALGIISDEKKYKEKAIRIFKRGIKELRNDGSVVRDSGRVGSALHYSNKAVAAMVTLAELALIDDVNLYSFYHKGFSAGAAKKDLRLAINFLLRAAKDEKLIHAYAEQGKKQGSTGFKEYSATKQDKRWLQNDMISWGHYYIRRFPDTDISKELLKNSSYLASKNKGYGEIAGANPRCFITGKP